MIHGHQSSKRAVAAVVDPYHQAAYRQDLTINLNSITLVPMLGT